MLIFNSTLTAAAERLPSRPSEILRAPQLSAAWNVQPSPTTVASSRRIVPGHAAAASWDHEYRTVDKAPTQFGETLLPLLLALLFGRADLGAAVSGSRRRGNSGWLSLT